MLQNKIFQDDFAFHQHSKMSDLATFFHSHEKNILTDKRRKILYFTRKSRTLWSAEYLSPHQNLAYSGYNLHRRLRFLLFKIKVAEMSTSL